jgi:hypothetical protein
MVVMQGLWNISFFGQGLSIQSIQNFVVCFRVINKTPGLISRNNFVKQIFVCIGHCNNAVMNAKLVLILYVIAFKFVYFISD